MKLFYTILLVCTGFLCLSQNSPITVTTSFNGFHCDGKPGLCSIDNQQNRSLSNTTLTLHDSMAIMIIDREKLSEEEIKKLFNIQVLSLDESLKYSFNLPESFLLSDSVKNSLGIINSKISFVKGLYPIQISEDFFTITFNLE